MHRCEVMMSRNKGMPCGDTAIRKYGLVWMCNYHFELFNASGNEGWFSDQTPCPGATDCGS